MRANPTFDSVSEGRVNALAGFGFTQRQREFLATVMVHARLNRRYGATPESLAPGYFSFVKTLSPFGLLIVIWPLATSNVKKTAGSILKVS
jgi:hypothetical protein